VAAATVRVRVGELQWRFLPGPRRRQRIAIKHAVRFGPVPRFRRALDADGDLAGTDGPGGSTENGTT